MTAKGWTIALLVLLALTGLWMLARKPADKPSGHEGHAQTAAQAKRYQCPMHPQIVRDAPGDCPICGMRLVPVEEDAADKPAQAPSGISMAELAKMSAEEICVLHKCPMDNCPMSVIGPDGPKYCPHCKVDLAEIRRQAQLQASHAPVKLSTGKQQSIGVQLGRVEKRPLIKEISTVGRVAYDPNLYVAQQEFVEALKNLRRAEKSQMPEDKDRALSMLNAVKVRLRLLGIGEDQIAQLEADPKVDSSLILPSKEIGSVWVYAPVYEYELNAVRVGQEAKVRVTAYTDREFSGQVRAIDPVLDPQTRTVRVRALVQDPEGLLKPDMYATAILLNDAGEGLAVPEEAVLPTGRENIVFVSMGDGRFEPRNVALGMHAKGFYEVKSGLAEGEEVVISGNFLMDSESRLKAVLSGMTSGQPAPAGHDHSAK